MNGLKIAIEPGNRNWIEDIFREVNGRAVVHTINYYSELDKLVKEAEINFGKMGVLCKNKKGTKITYTSGGAVPYGAYKYARQATRVTIIRGGKKWFLCSVEKVKINPSGGRKGVLLTPLAFDNAISNLKNQNCLI